MGWRPLGTRLRRPPPVVRGRRSLVPEEGHHERHDPDDASGAAAVCAYDLSPLQVAQDATGVRVHGDLRTQLHRASVSVVLNLAEGAAERPGSARNRYFRIALASLSETSAALDLASRFGVTVEHRVRVRSSRSTRCFALSCARRSSKVSGGPSVRTSATAHLSSARNMRSRWRMRGRGLGIHRDPPEGGEVDRGGCFRERRAGDAVVAGLRGAGLLGGPFGEVEHDALEARCIWSGGRRGPGWRRPPEAISRASVYARKRLMAGSVKSIAGCISGVLLVRALRSRPSQRGAGVAGPAPVRPQPDDPARQRVWFAPVFPRSPPVSRLYYASSRLSTSSSVTVRSCPFSAFSPRRRGKRA